MMQQDNNRNNGLKRLIIFENNEKKSYLQLKINGEKTVHKTASLKINVIIIPKKEFILFW